MKILTIRQPWATAIMQLGKDVENRTWTTKYRGKLFIHAGYYKPTELDFENLINTIPNFTLKSIQTINNINYIRGAILGYVTLTDIVNNSSSKWAIEGQNHWLLTNPVLLKIPVYCSGKQGLWKPDNKLKNLIK